MLVGVLLSVLLAGCVTEFTRWDAEVFVHTGEVTDITDSSAVFHGQILAPDASEVQEYGFVWDEGAGSTAVDAKRSLGSSPGPEPFRAVIESDMRAGVQYHVRAFARIRSGIVYGNSVRFTSEGGNTPKITGFSPSEGVAGTIVSIEGKRFCADADSVEVRFGYSPARVLEATSTLIRAELLAPVTNTGQVTIRVSCNGETAYSPAPFTILHPEITRLALPHVYAPDVLRMVVRNLDMQGEWTARIQSVDDPDYSFDLLPVAGWKPDTAKFAVDRNVRIGQYTVRMHSGYYGTVPSPDTLTVTSEWDQIADFPGPARCKALSFSVSQRPYVIMGTAFSGPSDMGRLWRYNPEQNTWTRLNPFPGGPRSDAIAFTRGNQAYLAGGDGSPHIWAYIPVSDSWVLTAMYPGSPGILFGFGIGSKIYIGSWGDPDGLDFWEYDTGTLQWTERSMQGYDFFPFPSHPIMAFTARGKGHIISWDVMLEYSPDTDRWRTRALPPGDLTAGPLVIRDTKVYAAGQQDNSSRLHVYDLDSDTWSVYWRNLPGGTDQSVLLASGPDTGYLLLAGQMARYFGSGCGTYCFRHDSLP